MLTAMQQLIEWLDSEECLLDAYSISHIKEQIDPKLLATEKEDLIEAWTAGREHGCKHDDPESGEDFYNSKYGQ